MRSQNKIKELLVKNDISRALLLLDEESNLIKEHDFQKTIINLRRRFQDIEKENLNETISRQDYSLKKNKIVSDILDLVNFNKTKNQISPLTSINLEVDPEVAKSMLNQVPMTWNQRSLYLGIDGGNSWLSLVDAEEYRTSASVKKIQELIVDTVKIEKLTIKSFVSFGPGDGEMDKLLISEIKEHLHYVPVDISEGLLYKSIIKLSTESLITVGILGDFEEGFHFIRKRLESLINSDSPTIVSMIGNTLGNLDKYEKHLLTKLKNFLKKDDYLLLQVSTFDQNWKIENDFWYNKENHTKKMRRFFAKGLARKGGINEEYILQNYEKVRIDVSDRSNIPNTNSIDFTFEKKKILSIRRYDWISFKRWIKDKFVDFEIEREDDFIDKKYLVGSGCILLKKR